MHPRSEYDALFVGVVAHVSDHFGAEVLEGTFNLRQITLVMVRKGIHLFFEGLLQEFLNFASTLLGLS